MNLRLAAMLAAFVLVGSILVAGVSYVIGHKLPAKYSSSALVLVQVSGTDAADASTGADDLAASYAEQVTATNVLTAAGKALGAGGPLPSGWVTAGAVDAQNVVQITVTNHDPKLAQAAAQAIAIAFVSYIDQQNDNTSANAVTASRSQLTPLQQQLDTLEARLAALHRQNQSATVSAEEDLLQQQIEAASQALDSALAQIAQDASAGRAVLTVESAASTASQTAPKPKLYAIVAFVIALVLLTRLATVRYRRVRDLERRALAAASGTDGLAGGEPPMFVPQPPPRGQLPPGGGALPPPTNMPPTATPPPDSAVTPTATAASSSALRRAAPAAGAVGRATEAGRAAETPGGMPQQHAPMTFRPAGPGAADAAARAHGMPGERMGGGASPGKGGGSGASPASAPNDASDERRHNELASAAGASFVGALLIGLGLPRRRRRGRS